MKEFIHAFNVYKTFLLKYNDLFDVKHPITQKYLTSVEKLFNIKLTDNDICMLLDLDSFPDSFTIQGYNLAYAKKEFSDYKIALHNKANQLNALMLKAKAKLFNLQETIPFEYFLGNDHIFIHCELSHNFHSVPHKVDTAFRQLLKVGKPQIWQVNNYIDNPLAHAVSFPIDPNKLEMFYACYYSFLFEAYKPDDYNLDQWLTISYRIEDWNNGLNWQSRGDFLDITDNYFYVA